MLAGLYLTFVRAPIVARKFWEEVRDETGGKPSDPTRQLARFLILNSGSKGAASTHPRHRIKDRVFFVKTLLAWNAFRSNEATNLAYHAGAEIPDVK